MSLQELVKLEGSTEPTTSVQAVHVLYEIGLDDEAVRAMYPKVADKPQYLVCEMRDVAFGTEPEMRTTFIRRWGNSTRVVES